MLGGQKVILHVWKCFYYGQKVQNETFIPVSGNLNEDLHSVKCSVPGIMKLHVQDRQEFHV